MYRWSSPATNRSEGLALSPTAINAAAWPLLAIIACVLPGGTPHRMARGGEAFRAAFSNPQQANKMANFAIRHENRVSADCLFK
jgi:hypothetical protein